MSRLKSFIDNLVIPWINSRQLPEDNGKPLDNDLFIARLHQQCPYGDRFGTELKLALGDGPTPIAPFVSDNVSELIFESDIVGIANLPDLIINLRLFVDTDKNDPNPALMCRILADEGDTVLFEEASTKDSAMADLDDPRGFIHKVIANYREQQYLDKINKIHDQIAENELKLHKLF
jgi:hypothetical protein